MIYACRDVDSNLHVYGNNGSYRMISRRRVLRRDRIGREDLFREIYPDVDIPDDIGSSTVDPPVGQRSR